MRFVRLISKARRSRTRVPQGELEAVFDEQTLPDFLIVSLLLGGGAAMLTGRALALAWQPAWVGLLWMVPLAAAVRFVHFVLFHSELFSLGPYGVDLAVLAGA